MPYIVMKRSDIPNGTLQVLDLDPNESQRNLVTDPPGQTKYVNAVQNDTVVTSGTAPIVMHREARGLAAWLITNVNLGNGDFASGTFTIDVADADPGDTVTVNATAVDGPSVVFTFVNGTPTAPNEVQRDGGDHEVTAANLANAINNPDNGLNPYVSAAAATNVVTVTAVSEGTASNAIALSDDSGAITTVDMAGGVDADPLTAVNANTAATAILNTRVRFGDLENPALVVDSDALEAAIPGTYELSAEQVREILDILAGRHYVVPKGTQVAVDATHWAVSPAVGTAGGPHFVEGTLRQVFETGSLKLSVAMGQLEAFLDQGFVYKGVAGDPHGEAVVVYDDDGTLYTL